MSFTHLCPGLADGDAGLPLARVSLVLCEVDDVGRQGRPDESMGLGGLVKEADLEDRHGAGVRAGYLGING